MSPLKQILKSPKYSHRHSPHILCRPWSIRNVHTSEIERGRARPQLGRQAGSVAHAWQTDMMIVGDTSSLIAFVSARWWWCVGRDRQSVGDGDNTYRKTTFRSLLQQIIFYAQ